MGPMFKLRLRISVAIMGKFFFSCVSVIKEVMVDRICRGTKIPGDSSLQFIAAVNPYRKHSQEMIKKLETAGLGYSVSAQRTGDTLGDVPLRHLVYRVHPLPQSFFPYVWDFGTVGKVNEAKYIERMVIRINDQIPQADQPLIRTIVKLLSESQEFFRNKKDECSFVSLRDVERFLQVFAWFGGIKDDLFPKLKVNEDIDDLEPSMKQILVAAGVSYYVRLDEQREGYADLAARILGVAPGSLPCILDACQSVFIDELKLDPTIAKNAALKENIFMMAVTIELKIPLFLGMFTLYLIITAFHNCPILKSYMCVMHQKKRIDESFSKIH